MAIACSRGARDRCSTPGCGKDAVALCDWPLTGAKVGKTCDKKLCEGCRVRVGSDKDYCRAHAELAKNPVVDALPIAVVGPRSFRALHHVQYLVVASLAANTRVVSGHAAGVDIVAEITAHQRRLTTSIYPVSVPRDASKGEFTKAAMARNTLVANEAREADVFLNAECRGTRDTLHKLQALGKVVRVHEEPPPAEHALLFHTAPHPHSKQAPRGYRGPSMLDITRGSGGEIGDPFAPSAPLLSEGKRRMQEGDPDAFNWYRARYVDEMRRSWVSKRPAWDALLARNHFTAVCYCPFRETCHRGVFADLLVKAGEKTGRRVVDGGEVVFQS